MRNIFENKCIYQSKCMFIDNSELSKDENFFIWHCISSSSIVFLDKNNILEETTSSIKEVWLIGNNIYENKYCW